MREIQLLLLQKLQYVYDWKYKMKIEEKFTPRKDVIPLREYRDDIAKGNIHSGQQTPANAIKRAVLRKSL